MPRTRVVTAEAEPQVAPRRLPSFCDFVREWNALQRQATPAMHDRITAWLDEAAHDGDRQLLLMVFRDAGKSTLVGLYCAWLLLIEPDTRIMVLSADQALAGKMTRAVRRIIERHPLTGHLKPKRSELWTADQLTVERPSNLRDPSILARGITGNITGSRADVVVCDDVEVPNTCDTPGKRAELRERLCEIGFVLVPGGTELFVGTPHSYYSIYADEPRPELAEAKPFLAGFKRLFMPIYDEAGRSRWPERFPDAHIERLRLQSGPTKFRSQMLLQPMQSHEVRLDPDRLLRYDAPIVTTTSQGRLLLSIAERRMVASACWWDPAYARPRLGDSSVVAAVFVDEQGDYWLHGLRYVTVDLGVLDQEDEASQQCRAVAEFVVAQEQPSVTLEVNGLGRFLPNLLRKALRDAGVSASVVEHTSRTNKEQRILDAFDPVMAARRLHVHASIWATPFIEEMREWQPTGNCRDDALDAVSGCIAGQPVRLGRSTGARVEGRPDWRGDRRKLTASTDFVP